MKPQSDLRGRSLLKTAGTLMTVFGALGVVLYLLALAGIAALRAATGGVFSASDDVIGVSLLFAGAVAELIAGILSLRAAKTPARAGKALSVLGGLTLLLALAGMGHIALRTGATPWWESALGLLLCVVVPCADLYAVYKLKADRRAV